MSTGNENSSISSPATEGTASTQRNITTTFGPREATINGDNTKLICTNEKM